MARPYWSGHIQISLVSFGVKLFTATEAKGEIRFHQISRSTGERVRHQKVLASALEDAPGEAAAPVEKDEIVKGYEYTKGQYVIVEPSEIANLRVPSKHTVDIQQFVSLDELAPEYLEKPYFVVPENDVQAEAFAVVRAALAKSKKAGLGKIAALGQIHHRARRVNSRYCIRPKRQQRFCGLDVMRRAYAHAIDSGYRFYSYGDACLLFRASS